MFRKIPSGLLLLSLCLAGCVQIPREHLSRAIEQQELSDHVHFLAQPGLKGRKPKTFESWQVRNYLKSRFKTYGLVPWANRAGYEQPFGFGTNVIGVLSGSDPNLADEIILVSAHYDHVGKTREGVLLGACDNASGVAVLLEVAEQLSMSIPRPKRPVCFAAFDCEERGLLGAFAFTCRDDFDESKLAAVVNIDMLGRDFVEVVDQALFVMGTEQYPHLREKIVQIGIEAKIRILPIGADLAALRGDHAPFEPMGIPCVFFTCGVCSDYHKPTDTADKLDYAEIKRSAAVILNTVETLSNATHIETAKAQQLGDVQELQAIQYVLETVSADYEKAGFDPNRNKQIEALAKDAKTLLAGDSYSIKQRNQFIQKGMETVLPSLMGWEQVPAENTRYWTDFYKILMSHRLAYARGYRKLAQHVLKHKPGLFRKVPKFVFSTYDLADDEFSIIKNNDGLYCLYVLSLTFEVKCESVPFPSIMNIRACFSNNGDVGGCVGSREEITDYCLLQWRIHYEDDSWTKTWHKILAELTSEEFDLSYQDWLAWRLKQTDYADEKQWAIALLQSDNPDVVKAAMFSASMIEPEQTEEIIRRIGRDPNIRPDVRARTMRFYDGYNTLLAWVDVLDNKQKTRKKEYMRFMDDSYPFSNRFISRLEKQYWEKKLKSRTLADEAETYLRQHTKQDFGKDKQLWREWIQANASKIERDLISHTYMK